MEHKKVLISIIVLIAVVLVTAFLLHEKEPLECVTSESLEIVNGDSMEPLLMNGQSVRVLYGYYNCNEINREDIIIINYSGSSDPLVKSVKAVENDRFHLLNVESGWNIMVNGEILKNSQGIPYSISKGGKDMISIYLQSYNNTIPLGAYLVLGEKSSGSVDSTKFGLIGKEDILGKIITEKD